MDKNNPILAVNEIFGPTIQGEGVSIGTPTMFLRLAGCNLACSWCDTRYAWDWKQYDSRQEIHPMKVRDVYDQIVMDSKGVRHLVISGGEPMLQQKALILLCRELSWYGWFIEIETAGSVPLRFLPAHINQFNVSPKLANSGNPFKKRYNPLALDSYRLTGKANFKFVVQSIEDFEEIDHLVGVHELKPVYIMPEGTDKEAITEHAKLVINEAIARGYRITPRLHIDLYGKQRGI